MKITIESERMVDTNKSYLIVKTEEETTYPQYNCEKRTFVLTGVNAEEGFEQIKSILKDVLAEEIES